MIPENYPLWAAHNFAILPKEDFNSRAKSSFDFNSLMLYSPAAGNNGGPTWKRQDGREYRNWFLFLNLAAFLFITKSGEETF